MRYRRRDIVWLEAHKEKEDGSIQKGFRPAVVVSNDSGNINSDILIVAYITSKIRRLDMPTHVLIGSMRQPSMVMCEQLETVSENEITRFTGQIREDDMIKINHALMASLGLCKC